MGDTDTGAMEFPRGSIDACTEFPDQSFHASKGAACTEALEGKKPFLRTSGDFHQYHNGTLHYLRVPNISALTTSVSGPPIISPAP